MTSPGSGSRRLWAVAVLAALLLAGVASGYASSSPDGLEAVAETFGISEQAQEHPAAGSPLADYETRGVDDARLSVGIAGVAGVALVLALGTGLAVLLRRRPGEADGREPRTTASSRRGGFDGTEGVEGADPPASAHGS